MEGKVYEVEAGRWRAEVNGYAHDCETKDEANDMLKALESINEVSEDAVHEVRKEKEEVVEAKVEEEVVKPAPKKRGRPKAK